MARAHALAGVPHIMKGVTFAHVLDGLYQGTEGLVELRALPSRHRTFAAPDVLPAFRNFAREHKGENVYFGVSTRKSDKDGTAENCLHMPALFADIDYKDGTEEEARQRLDAFPLKPSIVIASGAGLQTYWTMHEPFDLTTATDRETARTLLRRLATYLGADLSAAEVARILRVPGTRNYKYVPPRPVAVEVYEPERTYNPGEFDALLPADSSAAAAPVTIASGPIPEGQRNETLYRLARSLRSKGQQHGLFDRRGKLRTHWLQRFDALVTTAMRLDSTLGDERRQRPVPTLEDYLRSREDQT